MTGFTFQQPWLLTLLLLVPAMVALARFAQRKREALLHAYGGPRTEADAGRVRQRRCAEWCALAGLVLLVLALARPGANPRPRSAPEGGRDVVFVLDVSRSMLADDVRPSRLERAREDIESCLRALHNDRVGLVVFAGMAAIRSPLTTDYEFLRLMLKDASPDSVARGSTYLQSALEKVSDRMLTTDRQGYQDVVLLTDGEDQGSHPERTLEGLNARLARLLVVGYGEPRFGARIPSGEGATNGFYEYHGREVWTRLREDVLQTLTRAADQGLYVRGGTPGFDLGRQYERWSLSAPRRYLHGRGAMEYDEYFAWLLLPALVLLLYPWPLRRPATALLVVLCLLPAGPLRGQSVTNGLDRLRAAVAAETDSSRRGELAFGLGVALVKAQSLDEAVTAFQEAADRLPERGRAAACRYNLALVQAHLAEQTPSPTDQAALLASAIEQMRNALLLRPGWTAAAQGLEVLYTRRADAEQMAREEQAKQNQMNDQANALFQELQRLLAEQRALFAEGSRLRRRSEPPEQDKLAKIKALHDRQAALADQTETARGQMKSLRDMVRNLIQEMHERISLMPPPEKTRTQFDEPLGHINRAREAQDLAVTLLGPLDKLSPAVDAKQTAVTELEAALKSLSASQTGEDEQPDQNDASEMTNTSADSDNPADRSMASRGDLISDLVNRVLPRPNYSVEDILNEEQANAQVRTRNKGSRVTEGEKDW